MSDQKQIMQQGRDHIAAHLAECCDEELEWQDTGMLRNGRMREAAAIFSKTDPDHALAHVQAEVARQAMQFVVAAGNSKGPDAKDSPWLPIETAPKDGSEVLLYLPAPFNRIAKATWFDPWGNWIEGDDPDPIRDEYCGIGSELPTDWMPLPAAPSAPKGGSHG